jgi:hypothetical protein
MKSRSAANSSRSSATSLALTKEALAKRKAYGVVLGRPKGPAKNLQLDPLADKVEMYLATSGRLQSCWTCRRTSFMFG